ncbi:hypothetical protein [Lacticaseibacillus camelliae]|uniref:hypothetical protein n=1 Tax=Lacticaseibacillus camelliae TaxID=381742 RepID=UPI00138F9B48|nr:hypothetical protein [Lacticaseibacillus camelliae]
MGVVGLCDLDRLAECQLSLVGAINWNQYRGIFLIHVITPSLSSSVNHQPVKNKQKHHGGRRFRRPQISFFLRVKKSSNRGFQICKGFLLNVDNKKIDKNARE